MNLRVGMAGNTFLRCALKYIVLMAILAGDVLMSTGKREIRQGMVERGIFPAYRSMASGAVFSELTLVRVVLGMTGEAIGWEGGQRLEGIGFDMAAGAVNDRVLPFERKSNGVVIKIRRIGVHAVMAGQTALFRRASAEGGIVLLHGCGI